MQRTCDINGAAGIYHETVPAQQNVNLNSPCPRILSYNGDIHYKARVYLTIIPRALMGSESIAHDAEDRMGY